MFSSSIRKFGSCSILLATVITIYIFSTSIFLHCFNLLRYDRYISNEVVPPKQHIAFLKNYKCGSSTLQNILMRYGDTHNATFVLPCVGNILTYDKPFNINALNLERIESKYDMLVHHTVFNKEGFAQVMYEDAVYISILRHPVLVFESLYNFVHFEKTYKKNLTEFIKWDQKPSGDKKTRVNGYLGRNQMLYTLGFNASEFDDIEKVESWIVFLDESFDLILIAERFSESLILLRHLLGWSVDDIVYIDHNVRQDFFRSNLTQDEEDILNKYNLGDKMLYEHFVAVLERRIAEFGRDRMKEELEELESAINRYKNSCQIDKRKSKELSGNGKPWSPNVFGYKIDSNANETCVQIIEAELQYTSKLQRKQNITCRRAKKDPREIIRIRGKKKGLN